MTRPATPTREPPADHPGTAARAVSPNSATLAYDNDGNLTTDDYGDTLKYDAWNRPVSSTSGGTTLVTFAYDGLGRQVQAITVNASNNTLTTDLYYSAGSQVLEEDTANDGLQLNAQYVWSPVYVNALILRDDKFGESGSFNIMQRVYALQDANYNVTALVTPFTAEADANGDDAVGLTDYNILITHYGLTVSGGDAVGDFNHDGTVDILDYNTLLTHLNNTATGSTWQVTERLAYSPYGAFTASVRDNTGTWHNNWGDYLAWNITFQGGRWNPLTQQVLFQNRELDVNTGRWLSWDPTGYPNGPDAYLA